MEQNFIKHIYDVFKKMVEVYHFQKKTEMNKGQSYTIEYSSDIFVIKIEKYFREFYATLYKVNKPNREINLFNLLEYLSAGNMEAPKSEYFRKEKNIEECYRKQISHISSVIYDSYDRINEFFREENYDLKMAEFEKYWKNKHPEFYT